MKGLLFLVFFSGFFLSGTLWPVLTLQAEGISKGLSVSPAFQEVTIDQNDRQSDFSVVVTNTTDVLVTLRVAVFDFGSLDESGGVAFLGASTDLEKKYALASWMRPEKDVLTLGPGEAQRILVTIENRETLSPGGHYGALTFKMDALPREDGSGDQVSVNQLFSTLVFVKKVGGEVYDLALKESDSDNHWIRFQDVVRLRFQNNGNVHVAPRGIVTVTDPLERPVWRGVLNQESAIILPESMRIYPVRLEKLAESFIPGRYTMTIAYRFDGKDDFVTVSRPFIFVPWPAWLGLLAAGAVFGWYGMRRRKKTRHETS